jgi:hypothetical protein
MFGRGKAPPEIGVWPRDDDIRKYLRHPLGQRFANYPAATPWPDDQFTKRRIVEGAILTEPPSARAQTEPPAAPVQAHEHTEHQSAA